MHDQSLPYFVGLDIGTSTVRCVVGSLDPNDPSKPSIIGFGSAANSGMRKGVVVYVEETTEAIVQAVTEAERLSGIRIHSATVNVNGIHVSGMNSRGVVAISTANREITIEDRLRVEEAAAIMKLPANREIIQMFAKNYRLDGQENIKDPIGMHGVRLEVDAHIVTAATPTLRNLDAALEKAQIVPSRHTLSSLAAAEAVLSRQQKDAGTVLLDIGAATTNVLVIEDSEIQHVAVIPIGSQHITNDLAIGLKTDLDIAEEVKTQFAQVSDKPKKSTVHFNLHGTDHSFSMDDIIMITEARVEELLDYVERELKVVHRARKLPGGIVIVGGGAKLPGITALAREQLQLAARIGKLQSISGLVEAVADPRAFTAVGLMLLDMLLPKADDQTLMNKANSRLAQSMFGLRRMFKKP